MSKEKKCGPKGGVKHQPGRGHQHKSEAARKRRFQQKALKMLQESKEKNKKQWEVWDTLADEKRILRPDLRPEKPREFHDQ